MLDAFHIVKLGNQAVDEVRRRVQQETTGHRGRKNDPLYGIRTILRCGAEKLTDRHWQIIRYLRSRFERTGAVPTVYETCTANDIELDELERLFPDGYHRGAVKVAGLCVR